MKYHVDEDTAAADVDDDCVDLIIYWWTMGNKRKIN